MKPIPLLDYVGSPIFVFLFGLLLFCNGNNIRCAVVVFPF